MDEMNQTDNSLKGYRIAIIILAVILLALTFQYYRQVKILTGSEESLTIERDTLTNRLAGLMTEYDRINTENDTLNENMQLERHKVDSLMTKLKKERSWSYAKIKGYEREIGTLRDIMRGYVHQIDSLNTANKQLISENVKYRKDLSTYKNRTEMAEEQSRELSTKIKRGAIVRARDISLVALNKSEKSVSRVKRAARLRTDFVLSSNDLTNPGERPLYVRIISPDGYVLAESQSTTFEYEGEMIPYTASRVVDYQNEDLEVSVFYNGSGIFPGKYTVIVFMDGYLIGQADVILK